MCKANAEGAVRQVVRGEKTRLRKQKHTLCGRHGSIQGDDAQGTLDKRGRPRERRCDADGSQDDARDTESMLQEQHYQLGEDNELDGARTEEVRTPCQRAALFARNTLPAHGAAINTGRVRAAHGESQGTEVHPPRRRSHNRLAPTNPVP